MHVLGIVFAILYLFLLGSVGARLHYNDFGKFYWTTRYSIEGVPMYGPSPATSIPVGTNGERGELLNMNPPHFHLPLLPLAYLPIDVAARVWMFFNLLAIAASAWILWHELTLRLQWETVLTALVAALGFASTGALVVTGQVTFILLVPMLIGWRAARRGSWHKAGAWIGLLVSVKPFLGLLLPYFLLTRRWGAFAAACFVCLTSFGIGLLMFGWSAHMDWIAAQRGVDWYWPPMNGSIRGLVSRAIDESPLYQPIVIRPEFVTPIWLGLAGATCGVTLWVSMRTPSIDRAFGLLLLGALLISPLGWVYYLWLTLGPLLALWKTARPGLVWVGACCLFLPLILVPMGQPSAAATVTIGSAYFWGTAVLWLAVLRSRPATSPRSAGNLKPIPHRK